MMVMVNNEIVPLVMLIVPAVLVVVIVGSAERVAGCEKSRHKREEENGLLHQYK